MQVSLEEIRQLRQTLNENRAHHEALLTQARILREHCQEIRQICRQASREMAVMVSQAECGIDSSPRTSEPFAHTILSAHDS